jgi:tripartite motif-containing protein 71
MELRNFAIATFAVLITVGCGGGSSGSAGCGSHCSDPNTVLVADSWNQRVEAFDSKNNYLSQFGHSFNLISGIARDPSQNIYVRDGNANCDVDKFDSKGNFLLQFGQCAVQNGGVGPGIFDNTGRVATDASGNVWVTSPDFYTMQEFDSSGKFVTMVCMADIGVANCPVTTPFSVQPQGIGIDASGNIYVSNVDPFTGYNVIKFDKTGTYKATIGSTGSGNGQFNPSDGIAFDSAGNMYVVDSGNYRVEKFDSQGNYVSTLGGGAGQLVPTAGIAIDHNGNIYVTDSVNNRVEELDPNGNYLGQFGTKGSGNGQLNIPIGVTVIP